ncbi:kinase-like domain-containing protein [Xylariaceae sp. FL1651]|nr:kinase-like domain-containing protein [Xylariaceae sp. FL1651]
MEVSKTTTSTTYAVSRSRGKRQDESRYLSKLRQMKKSTMRSSDESESEEDMEPGAVILHKLFNRKVTLRPSNTVVKSRKRVPIGDAKAQEIAVNAGIPAPSVHKIDTARDGQNHIHMDYIQGQKLEALWPDMSIDQKTDIAGQPRELLKTMRSVVPPIDHLIGACDETEIRDTRVHFTYHLPPCPDEAGFNTVLLSTLHEHIPPLVKEAISRRLRTSHKISWVQDGKISGIVDWEDSGWYPKYWEYVKFFQRSADKDWKQYAEQNFPSIVSWRIS